VKAGDFFFALSGAVILFLYGIVPTFQPSYFHRIYATYGGIFVVMSLLWGWTFDKTTPDTYDLIGALIILIGVSIFTIGQERMKISD
jgi:small multidrug resistance family-3 protein